MASRGPYWYVTVSLLQYIGKPFQARTGVFFDKSLQACRITLFNCSPWPWFRLSSRLTDRIRQENIIDYHGEDRLSSKNSHFIKNVYLRASAPLHWLMEYSFRKKKETARETARAVSFACCQGPSFSYVNIENHNSSIINWFLIDEMLWWSKAPCSITFSIAFPLASSSTSLSSWRTSKMRNLNPGDRDEIRLPAWTCVQAYKYRNQWPHRRYWGLDHRYRLHFRGRTIESSQWRATIPPRRGELSKSGPDGDTKSAE